MDTVFAGRRLSVWLAVFVMLFCCAFYSPRSAAQEGTETYAHTQCLNWLTANDPTHAYACFDEPVTSGWRRWAVRNSDGTGDMVVNWTYSVVVNPCDGMTGATIPTDGMVYEGSKTCVMGPRQSDGSQASCGMNINPVSPPTFDRNSGKWTTFLSVMPTGQICGLDGGTPSGAIVGPADAPPVPPADAPPPLPDPVPPSSDPPKICGGVSCYDPASDSYCASSGGQQFCVPGSTARSPAGGCTSSGDATLCAGAPNPPPPDPGKVPDPPTATAGSDHTTQSGGTTAGSGTTTVTTTVYSNTGSAGVSSGAQAGDSTPTPPASSSTAPSTPSTFSGGGSCTTPPACTGDAVMCGIARTQWATTCQLHTDLAGSTGKAPTDFDTLKTKYTQSDVWSAADTSMDGTVGGQANSGNYDQSGFGWGTTCPLHDIPVSMGALGQFSIPLADKCYVGDWLRKLVIGFALFSAVIITAGGRG